MTSFSDDPFGFDSPQPAYSPRPLTVVAQPGQEVRIVVPDRSGAIPGGLSDTGTPSPSPDTGTPSPSPDTGTPSPSPDSGTPSPSPDTGTPSPSPDAHAGDPLGFDKGSLAALRLAPNTVLAYPGQELRVIVVEGPEPLAAFLGDTGTPSPSPDSGTPSPSPDTGTPSPSPDSK